MIVRPKMLTYFYLSINYKDRFQCVKRRFSSLINVIFNDFKYLFLVEVDLFCNGVFLVKIYTIETSNNFPRKLKTCCWRSPGFFKVCTNSTVLMKTFSTMWQPWSQEWCLVISRCVFVYVEATFLLCCKRLSQGTYDLITWFRLEYNLPA